MLREARALGDVLVVVLSNDAHNRKPNAVPAGERSRRLQALGLADRIVVGDADGFAATLRREKPDILILGYDQNLPDPETQGVAEELGVRIVRMPWFPGKEDRSSSNCS
jgi:FAD synthetase